MKTILLFFTCFFLIEAAHSQEAAEHKKFSKADSAAIDALAMYPDTIRDDIFQACMYPEAIVRIANEQKNTSSDFDTLISTYPKDVQEDLWNLSRYPGLISQIAQGGKKSGNQLNDIAVAYPEEIRATAVKYGISYYDVIKQMDDLQNNAAADFNQIISDYPQPIQEAYRDLIQLPEVLSLLNEHLDIAVLAGDRYRRDPERVKRKMDSLNVVLTQQRADELQAWKDSVQQNPEVAGDLKTAATDYATEEGYTQDEINQPVTDDQVNNYSSNPYPYWFGYPTWYPYSYWYPYPYWFDWGFYYNPAGNIVFIGTPSYHFTNWYFHYPEHWNRYPHLGQAYISHYYGPKRTLSSNSVVVHSWVRNNKNYLPQDFLTNKSSRAESFKEAGQLQTDLQKQHGGSVTPVQRTQYIQNNKTKYPRLNASSQPALQEPARQQMNLPASIPAPVRQQPAPLPRIEQRQPERAATPPVTTPRPTATPQPTASPRPTYNYERINNAQQYHRSTWEQAPTSRPQQAPAMQAPVRQQAAPMRQPSAPAPSPMPAGGGGRRR